MERILRKHGLIEFKDFKKKTEEEVAAIRGVGKVSMEILKENGVVFKKKRKRSKELFIKQAVANLCILSDIF